MHEEILERCEYIKQSLEAVQEYLQPIESPADFLTSKNGQLILDAITLRLQVIGENAKKVEDIYPKFFWTELAYDVGYIVRFRDFVSHHYERLDNEFVYRLCTTKLPKFSDILGEYLRENNNDNSE